MDCGGLTVEFFNDDASESSLDTDIFLDDRTVDAFQFTSLYSEVVAKADVYPIKYRVYHTLYN